MLSCALALLAAQPWVSTAKSDPAPAMAVRSVDTTCARTMAPATNRQEIRAGVAAVTRREIARAEAEAQIHATWALLRQILARELNLAAAPGLFVEGLDVTHFEPIPLALVGAPVPARRGVDLFASPPPLSHETQSAIAHCLLAPPV